MMSNKEQANKVQKVQPKKKAAPKKPAESVSITSIAHLDGIDHINIDNNCAKTELGKLLTPFAKTPFEHPEYGPFFSLEGFWHWIRSSAKNEVKDEIRSLHGKRAHAFGKKITEDSPIILQNFRELVIVAMYYKIIDRNNAHLYDLFVASDLPIKFYYLYGIKKLEINPDYARWLCDGVEQIRTHLKQFGKDSNNPFSYTKRI